MQSTMMHVRYLSVVPSFDLNFHVLTYVTGSGIFITKHMFPNPIVLFMHAPTSLRLTSQNCFHTEVLFSEEPNLLLLC